jgi:hypothetical protein
MKTFTYNCVKVQQTPESEPFFVTSIKAKELLAWCDVPRSKEGFMAGYQRELDGREARITEFFLASPKNNIIPNAVIVAVDQNRISITGGATAVVTVRHEEKNESELLASLIEQFERRLNAEEIASIDIQAVSVGDRDDEGADIDAATPPESYLAELTKNLRLMRDSSDKLDEQQVRSIKQYMNGVAKPGLILDGQHRVFGAKEVHDFDVELPVVVLPKLPPSEQVFHFYVLNNKAKPLNRTHLRRIISTSLSKKEIDALYDRLKDAGVEARSAEWTHRMNTDADSPFVRLIDMGLNGSTGVISENVAYQVVSKFMLLKNRFPLLVDDVPEWNVNSNDYRLSAFYAFWRAIKGLYPNAWNKASNPTQDPESQVDRQIFFKVSLIRLQEFVLQSLNNEMPKRNMKGEPSPFANISDLEREVSYHLPFLKEEFFLKEWRAKGLDTSAGHELFQRSIDAAISKQCKNLGNMTLFKG